MCRYGERYATIIEPEECGGSGDLYIPEHVKLYITLCVTRIVSHFQTLLGYQAHPTLASHPLKYWCY